MENSYIKKALFEAAFVVLGVVLAFTANEIRENIHNKNRAEEALKEILHEIKLNRESVEKTMDYHNAVLDSLKKSFQTGREPKISVFSQGFLTAALVSRTAYESAIVIGAFEHLDYQYVLEISSLYALQDRYENQARNAGELIYTALFERGAKGIVKEYRNLFSVIMSFAVREEQLIESYDKKIEKLLKTLKE